MICAIGITSSLVLVSFNVQSLEDHKREPHSLVGAWLVQITDAVLDIGLILGYRKNYNFDLSLYFVVLSSKQPIFT